MSEVVWSVFLVDFHVALADGGAGGPSGANVVPHHGSAFRKPRLGVVMCQNTGPRPLGFMRRGNLRCSRKGRTARWAARVEIWQVGD